MLDDLVFPYKSPHGKLVRMSIHENIKAARIARGWAMERLAEEISTVEGIDKPLAWQTIQQWENGTSAPRRKRLEVVAQVLGMTPAELLADGPPAVQELDLDQHPELSAIRTVRLKLQAGVSGFAVEPDPDSDGPPIFFRSDWLRQRGFKPYNLIAVKIKGDSMEDKLYHGDTVVIHTADTEPVDGEVFAVNYEGEPVIKRMKRERGRWWLASDNLDKRRYPDKECAGESCIIVGHIVHKQSERI